MKRFLLFLAALTLAFVLQAQTSAGSHGVGPAVSQAHVRTTLLLAVDDHRVEERGLAEIERFVAATDRTR